MTGRSGDEEIERRIDALYDPLERLGVLLPIERTVDVGPHKVEVVATLADCTTTSIFYRSPREAMIWPHIVGPPETGHSGGGTFWKGLHVHHSGPVMPHRTSIAVAFVLRARGSAEEPVTSEPVILPIDRSLTAPHERFASKVSDVDVPGVRVRVLGGSAGVMSTVLELLVEATDETALMMDLGEPFGGHLSHLRRGPGPVAFWREWVPEQAVIGSRRTSGPGGRFSTSASSSVRLTARRLSDEERASRETEREQKLEPTEIHEDAWTARSIPDGTALPLQGSSSGGGTPGTGRSLSVAMTFGAPAKTSPGVVLTLKGVVLHHFGSERTLRVPGPRANSMVDLSGNGFDWRDGRVELQAWRSRVEGGWMTHRLVVAPSELAWRPDIRVLHDDASVSLWMRPMSDGTHRGGLPAMYNEMFEKDDVSLALRMVGVQSDPIRVEVPLSAAKDVA